MLFTTAIELVQILAACLAHHQHTEQEAGKTYDRETVQTGGQPNGVQQPRKHQQHHKRIDADRAHANSGADLADLQMHTIKINVNRPSISRSQATHTRTFCGNTSDTMTYGTGVMPMADTKMNNDNVTTGNQSSASTSSPRSVHTVYVAMIARQAVAAAVDAISSTLRPTRSISTVAATVPTSCMMPKMTVDVFGSIVDPVRWKMDAA